MNSPNRIIDIIVQRATIDLFGSYGMAIAPSSGPDTKKTPYYDYLALVNFSSAQFRGSLTFSASPATLGAMKKDLVTTLAQRDWTRELANQLMGRIKNKLIRYQLTLEATLPQIVDCRTYATSPAVRGRSSLKEVIYVFRTVGSDVFVTLYSDYRDENLALSNTVFAAQEGDVIIFD